MIGRLKRLLSYGISILGLAMICPNFWLVLGVTLTGLIIGLSLVSDAMKNLDTRDQLTRGVARRMPPLIRLRVPIMRTTPQIALCSLLLICGCILLFEMVTRDKVSDVALRPEDYSTYVLYAEAVANKNKRITASMRGQRGLDTARKSIPDKALNPVRPAIRREDYPSYVDYAKAMTEAYRRSIEANRRRTEAKERSIKLLAAEQGDVDAQLEIGRQYLRADGVPQDYNLAAKWLEAAAKSGSAEAQYMFGMMHAAAQGFEEDYETAVRWISLSAAQGFASAQHQLAMSYAFGFGTEKSEALALQWYLAAAQQGYLSSQYHLAIIYDEGYYGVDKDPDLAFRFYKLAAARGHPEAQAALGYGYFWGEGVEADIETSFKWYQAAAEQGITVAQIMLGQIYLGGGAFPGDLMARLGHDQFMRKDKVKALMWFLVAAESGDEDAQFAVQMFGRRLTDHEAQLARELADRCRQTSYQGC